MTIRKGSNIIAGSGPVDQTYDNTSINAQSGIAVAEAVQDKLNTTQITNCVLELPETIKLELSDSGTLTLKSGSKTYIPYGSGNFIEQLKDTDISGTRSNSQTCYVFATTHSIQFMPTNLCFSGTIAPTFAGNYAVWYDTTNNKIGTTSDGGNTWNWGYSLPIAIVTGYDGQIRTIDEVFSGYGYLDKTIFIVSGLTVLRMNGKNSDGTLKSNKTTYNTVMTYTETASRSGTLHVTAFSSVISLASTQYSDTPKSGWVTFDANKNISYSSLTVSSIADIGIVSLNSGVVTGLKIYNPVAINNTTNFTSNSNHSDLQVRLADRFSSTVNVKDFGALGDGSADDTSAINKALDYIRKNATSKQVIYLDLCGGTYRIDGSINATKINSWGWGIKNGTLIGRCTGKAVLDLTGSRGYKLQDITIQGIESNMPYVGIQCARCTDSGYSFCDNSIFENITVHGYFSLSAVYFYGQESTTYLKCKYWNAYYDGYAGIHVGKDFETYQSDFVTAITGDSSYINNKYINCDWRYSPLKSSSITAISKANPCVVTVNHPEMFSVGMQVSFSDISGMTELNRTNHNVTAINGNDITLNVDSSGYSTYISGGIMYRSQKKPTILIGRMGQQSFDHCYVVCYGHHAIELKADTLYPLTEGVTLDFLCEGQGCKNLLKFNSSSTNYEFREGTIKTYGSWFQNSMISNANTNIIRLKGVTLDWGSRFKGTPTLFDDDSLYILQGVDLKIPTSSVYSMNNITGSAYCYDGQAPVLYNIKFDQSSAGSFTPIVTPELGSITDYTATGLSYKIGDLVFISGSILITDNGTGSGSLSFTTPFTFTEDCYFIGRENSVTGKAVVGRCQGGQSNISIHQYDNSYPGGTGHKIFFSGIGKV